MKTFLFILLTIQCALFNIISFSQPCLPDGITFTTQEQIDNFQTNHPNCTEIEGDVNIAGDDISSLTGLNVLTFIGGSFTIGSYNNNNPNLTNLTGLENLANIGGSFSITNNSVLTSLTGLENLVSIDSSFIIGRWLPLWGTIDNPLLSSLSALNNLTFIGGNLSIWGNGNLTSLTGLENLTSIGGLSIAGTSLTSIAEFENITSIAGSLFIGVFGPYTVNVTGNNFLLSLTGLDNISSVGGDIFIIGNPGLSSLAGLESLTSVGGVFRIQFNYGLTSMTGLEGLSSIEGGLTIAGNNALTSLTGLENVTSIEGDLSIGYYDEIHIGNPALTSLTGLGNITSIGGNLKIIGNYALTSLTGLESLTSVGGDLSVGNNDALTSLSGLDNIEAASINSLYIYYNISLSTCEVPSICVYLASPNGSIVIHDNAPGCNSQAEVEVACVVGVDESAVGSRRSAVRISPNPFSTSTTIEYELSQPGTVRITIYNKLGGQVEVIEQIQGKGLNKIGWAPKNLPNGIYYFRLQAGEHMATGKMMLMR